MEEEVVEVFDEEKSKKSRIPKSTISGLLIGIVELVVGILLLIKPVEFTRGIIITFGVILTLIGLVSLIDYFRMPVRLAMQERSLVWGIVMMILGLFCVCDSAWFISTFPALTVLYGIVVLLVGISSLQDMFDLIRMKSNKWILPFLLALIAIVFAVLIFVNPFGTTEALWTFVAVSIIVEAVIEVVSVCVKHFRTRKSKV